ncbi:uncharacterized protein LOC121653977 [Melanotaenia boesemani]|uniref:uncharacterized protein LOC121653977 n=1 Tax=Melanotaenia boesemani TaxID=1250792 RepID=UPI001C05C699|nr:uncharacterized protein LOC121653977 [Melanotaenia boesemani]
MLVDVGCFNRAAAALWSTKGRGKVSATRTRHEPDVKHVALSRDPDLVIVLAPSNNLTASRTIQEAGAAFCRYLETVCDSWTNVVVADFVPRLTVGREYQDMMRHEFQRVAAHLRLTYWHWADHFPLHSVELWSRDGVHLGDDRGILRLADLIWNSTYQHLETLAAKVPRRASPPQSTRVSPRIVVKGNAPVPRPLTPEWTCVGPSMKVAAAAAPKEKFHLPLQPVYFSSDILQAMDKAVPSFLGEGVPTDKLARPAVHPKKPGVSKRKRIQKQTLPTPTTTVSAAVTEVATSEKTSIRPTRKDTTLTAPLGVSTYEVNSSL